ncbi:tRNA-uridine aminocarboxypropyltransferase 2-like [Watersipora subatra]|uniref:tRNA-uridine aminocarboxypropyltransferase 2-like n=1 Tax=Watersipora subatra TaxID=2589382 RepID=UPI00355C7532
MSEFTEDVFPDVGFALEPPRKRETCERCRRPATVCWCPFLPSPIDIKTRVIILQHPYEGKRRLSTTPMLVNGLAQGSCTILLGSRFNVSRYPLLEEVVGAPNTVLLYPDSSAVPINTLPTDKPYNLIVLDGTWLQARGIYGKNSFLQQMKKVKVTSASVSKYVVRTQPTDECLSTLESTALALESLENDSTLFEKLTKPLNALCDFQLRHGAVAHQSKEYLIKNGIYKSQKNSS